MSSGGHGGGGLPGMGWISGLLHTSHGTGGLHIQARPLIIAMAVILFAFLLVSPSQTFRNFEFVFFLAPIWIPAALVYFAFDRWLQFRRSEFIASQRYILLELRMPRDTKKTPLAMETVFANLNFSSGETTWYKKYIKGGVRPWWSAEIVSLGGQVHFYIWTRETLRRGLESYFYAQYPGMEIIEAEDYSRLFDPLANEMWGAEYLKTKEDPMPIKTYVDYGLDKVGTKPEEQIDPLAQLVEFLGSIGPKEQLWIQIPFRQSRDEKYGRSWKEVGQDLIKSIKKDTISKRTTVDPNTGEVREVDGFPNPTEGQKGIMALIERHTNKPGFDVGIRAIYMAEPNAFQASMITYMINMFKPFSNEGGNGIKLAELFSAKFNDYPWEDPSGHHKHHEHVRLVEFYRRRSYFHPPYTGPWMILSTEEIATLFHVPSSTIETPTLPRIPSATSGAPANLPT